MAKKREWRRKGLKNVQEESVSVYVEKWMCKKRAEQVALRSLPWLSMIRG